MVRSVNANWRGLITVLAAALVLSGVFLLVSGKDSMKDAPRLQLRETFQNEGKQWAYFRVHAPSNTVVAVQYERLLGADGTQILDSVKESNTRQPVMLLPGGREDIQVQALVPGVWRVKFVCQGPRKGVRLRIDRLAYAWHRRTIDFLSATPWSQEWVLESEPITNTVNAEPFHRHGT
jgi:hypothetical protein